MELYRLKNLLTQRYTIINLVTILKITLLGREVIFFLAINFPLFSEIISVWVISYWIKLGKPKHFSFVELGPGNGEFCKTFCKTLKVFLNLKKL